MKIKHSLCWTAVADSNAGGFTRKILGQYPNSAAFSPCPTSTYNFHDWIAVIHSRQYISFWANIPGLSLNDVSSSSISIFYSYSSHVSPSSWMAKGWAKEKKQEQEKASSSQHSFESKLQCKQRKWREPLFKQPITKYPTKQLPSTTSALPFNQCLEQSSPHAQAIGNEFYNEVYILDVS